MSGSSGQFLRLIVSMFLTDKVFISNKFPNGAVISNDLQELTVRFKNSNYNSYLSFIDQDFSVSEDSPFVFAEHSPPNWEKCFRMFPNLTNIIIGMDANMHKRQILNMEIKNKPNSVKDEDTLKKILNNQSRALPNPKFYYPIDMSHVYPKQYSIVRIPYYDIIHKRDSVLSTLSYLTERPVGSHIIKTYDNYLQSQHELYPWYDDSIT